MATRYNMKCTMIGHYAGKSLASGFKSYLFHPGSQRILD
jgi:hypothetical protein